jgi:TRAP transporter 4TM/12TM fusion protein
VDNIFQKTAKHLSIFAAVALSLFALYTAATGIKVDIIQRGVVLFCIMLIVFSERLKRNEGAWYRRLIFWIAMLVSGYALLYQIIRYRQMAVSMGVLTNIEFILGVALIVVLLVATKLTVGWPIVIIATLLLLYAHYGNYLPGLFGHRGYKWFRIISHMINGTSGIFGVPLGTAATMVVMFVLFGSFLEASGGSSFFMDLAIGLTGKSKGGPAKAAVVSSALMGTISGNAASNVVTTGTFTIPLMKRTGYESHVAGAIEAVASTGGQIMPPVMGAAAFIMAEMIGVQYGVVALAAVIPSILFYISTFAMVHFEAVKKNVAALDSDDLPDLNKTWKQNWHTLLSIVALIAFLVMRYSPVKSALYGIIVAVLCSFFRKHTRITPTKFYLALVNAGRSLVPVGIACASAGLIIGVVSLTGLGLKISSIIIAISGGHLILALIFTFITLFILGMGMPTAAAYIMVATLVAPSLTEMGLPVISAHMFCLYGAVLSAITPPVALAAYAAAGIAKANPMKIGFTACKFGVVAFIVPFFFAYQPSLLWIGTPMEIILTFVTATIGVIVLAASVQGYAREKVPLISRLIAVPGALAMMYPGGRSDLIGLVLVAVAMVPQLRRRKRI